MSEQTANLCTTDAAESLREIVERQARDIERLKEGQSILILARDEQKRLANEYRDLWSQAAVKAQPCGVVLPDELTDEMRNSMAYVPGLSDTTMQDLLWLALKLARLNSSPVSAGGVDDRAAFEAAWCERYKVTLPEFHPSQHRLGDGYNPEYSPFIGSAWWGYKKARAAITASTPNTAQPEVAENTGSQAMATHQLHCQGLAVGRGVEGAATSDETPSPDDIFAWATFDGEGGYDLRLYQDNESYRDEFISMNGDKYASWVFPLYRAALSAPSHSEQVRDVLPGGWTAKPTDDCEGFIISSPRVNGVASHFSVFPDSKDYASCALWKMLAAAPSAGSQEQGE